jgi:transposase InsO family protein
MIAAPMKDQTADSVHNAFREKIILTHGVPEEVLTDQGKNFLSKTMDDFYSQLGVKRKKTTAYRPCCDGLVERFNRTLVDMMASYLSTSTNKWDDYLSHATFAYNTSVHASTGYTPHYLMFGRDAMEPGDVQPPVRNELITD